MHLVKSTFDNSHEWASILIYHSNPSALQMFPIQKSNEYKIKIIKLN